MNNCTALIICSSTHHHNTQRVAKAMAEVMNASVVAPQDVDLSSLTQARLIGLGSGIYFGSHARCLIELVRRMPQQSRKVFLFSTAGTPMFWRLFHYRLRRVVESRGFEIVGEFNCRGWDSVGPLAWIGGLNRHRPNETDLARAREFARGLLQQLQ
jgi:flavodoxin